MCLLQPPQSGGQRHNRTIQSVITKSKVSIGKQIYNVKKAAGVLQKMEINESSGNKTSRISDPDIPWQK